MSELMDSGFGRTLLLLCSVGMIGVATYVRDGYEALHQSKFECDSCKNASIYVMSCEAQYFYFA